MYNNETRIWENKGDKPGFVEELGVASPDNWPRTRYGAVSWSYGNKLYMYSGRRNSNYNCKFVA